MNNNNNLIIRKRTDHFSYPKNLISLKRRKENNCGNASNGNINLSTGNLKNRKIIHQNDIPKISIKKEVVNSLTNEEVLLINGNWDTTNKIPSIIAEMHNVKYEDLQNTWNSKFADSPGKSDLKGDLSNCVIPSPRGSDSGIEGDCSDGNLSWLLNYRIHELPPVPDCATSTVEESNAQFSTTNNEPPNGQVYIAETMPKHYFDYHNVQNVNISRLVEKPQSTPSVKLHGHAYRYAGPKKPPFTYTELIEHALNEKGELTVSGIYQWISDHFPFYKNNDDRWKNSVRHNLSINPHFRKGNKAVHGAGHLWTIAQREDKKTWNIKKQRMQQFMQTTLNDLKSRQLQMELETATASILPDIEDQCIQNKNEITIVNHDKDVLPIEIEYINVLDVTNGLEDFLCPPVPKEQVVEECGLSGDYLITDLNPNALGLNLCDGEIISGSNLYDDLNFQCYELQNE